MSKVVENTQKAIGKIVTNASTLGQKDAIHIAVVVVQAGQHFVAGQPVSIYKGKAYGAFTAGRPVLGIVDPFLTVPVYADQMFYLYLTPNTITDMRHEWTLPEFDDAMATVPEPETVISIGNVSASAGGAAPENDTKPRTEAQRKAAERWLRNFAEEMYMDYEDMVANAIAGNALCAGTESYDMDATEFWENMETLTGMRFNERHRTEDSYFRCAC